MHNEYITKCCILSEKGKLLLLKYAKTDITKISNLLFNMALELMNQCYTHVDEFHRLNKQQNKKYNKLEPLVIEQLKDMEFIKRKFIEYFASQGPKTKADLFTYILAFQITAGYFNEYLYKAILKSLKDDFTPAFWDKHHLHLFEMNTRGFPDIYILRDTVNECSTGQLNVDLNKVTQVIDKTSNNIDIKLENAKAVGNILDNYNSDYAVLNRPYKDTTLDLIDHIIVSREMDKPKQHIKRM